MDRREEEEEENYIFRIGRNGKEGSLKEGQSDMSGNGQECRKRSLNRRNEVYGTLSMSNSGSDVTGGLLPNTNGVSGIIRGMHDTTRPFFHFFRHPGSEEPSRRKGMTGLGARRGEQHGSRNGGITWTRYTGQFT